MTQPRSNRRTFLRAALCVPATSLLVRATETNIKWGLGLVTWRGKAEWPEILADVDAAGFDGVEPFTPKFLNDDAMAQLEKLLPQYPRLRVSSLYWGAPFHTPSEHDRLIQQAHQMLGYLKRFGAERLTFGPPGPMRTMRRSQSVTRRGLPMRSGEYPWRNITSEPIFIPMSEV